VLLPDCTRLLAADHPAVDGASLRAALGDDVYLLLAEPQNTVLAAILTFSDRVIYPAYRAAGASALDDQALAGDHVGPQIAAFALALLWPVFQSLGPSPAPTSPRRCQPAPRPRDDPPPCPLPLSNRR
jgi:hypothetical protein